MQFGQMLARAHQDTEKTKSKWISPQVAAWGCSVKNTGLSAFRCFTPDMLTGRPRTDLWPKVGDGLHAVF